MIQSQAVSALSALADDTRLAMLRHLVRAGTKGSPAGALASVANASPSRATFHLNALTASGLVKVQKAGRHMIYTADFNAIGRLMGFLLQDCCAGHAEIAACCAPAVLSQTPKNPWKI